MPFLNSYNVSQKSLNFSGPGSWFIFAMFENDTMKLSVKEKELTAFVSQDLCYVSTTYDFKIFPRAWKVTVPFKKRVRKEGSLTGDVTSEIEDDWERGWENIV